jgi:hypothetical protein
MADQTDRSPGPEIPIPWLADAPLFIDGEQVSALYDAVVSPEVETGKISISTKGITLSKTSTGGKLGARVSTRQVLAAIFPFLDAQVSLEGSRGREKSTQAELGDTIELHPIRTPHRQLVQLALHYAAHLPERVRYARDEASLGGLDESYVEGSPRALVFLDLPPGQAIIPLAAEQSSGRVVTVWDDLTAEIAKKVHALPSASATADDAAEREAYWHWLAEHYRPNSAVDVLERGIGEGGPVSWVDYRVHIKGERLYLSLRGRGRYETGIFAYSTIQRGHRYGLRVVGMLKSGPGLNVLAVFEK